MDNKFAILAISEASTWNGCGRCTSDELQEAKMLAYKALEKQTPRTCVSKDRIRGGQVYYTDYYCPICNKQQKAKSWYGSKRTQDGWHCERCGQKLRWRADND